MRETWPEIERWRKSNKAVALATTIRVEGSGLRPVASKLAVTTDGGIAGSVSGGCVEGAIIEESQAVIQTGQPVSLSYGVPDPTAWSVGLACGGSIDVFVESLSSPAWQMVEDDIRRVLEKHELAALLTIVAGSGVGNKLLVWPDGRQIGDLGSVELNAHIPVELGKTWTTHSPGIIPFESEQGEGLIFIDVLIPLPRLIIIGAVHIAIPLITIAKAMNFRTIVVDPRSAFATRVRFPHADELIVEWPSTALEKLAPDPATYVVCLTHDDKLDVPALQAALASPARYIGVLGSRKTHADRLEALRELGVPEDGFSRIHAPIGLDLGSIYPEEIALAIMAEIIAERHAVAMKDRLMGLFAA
jgi:xanthine dehydrogenase accessory factor